MCKMNLDWCEKYGQLMRPNIKFKSFILKMSSIKTAKYKAEDTFLSLNIYKKNV